jgi:hypothetical protein
MECSENILQYRMSSWHKYFAVENCRENEPHVYLTILLIHALHLEEKSYLALLLY